MPDRGRPPSPAEQGEPDWDDLVADTDDDVDGRGRAVHRGAADREAADRGAADREGAGHGAADYQPADRRPADREPADRQPADREPADHAAAGPAAPDRDGPVPVPVPAAPARARSSVWDRLWRDLREIGVTVVVALVIAVLVKTFLVQPFFIPSESMESTLLVGDRVLVSKLEPGPGTLERGDVVVFVDPGGWLPAATEEPSVVVRALTFVGLLPANSGEHLIKRVIGLPGDTVSCCDPDGRLLVNDVPVDEESYLFAGDVPSTIEFSVEVPEGRMWVQGDHRSVSEDSRYQLGQPGAGMVPLDNVVGRAVLVMWPFDRFTPLPTPEGVFDEVGGLDGVS